MGCNADIPALINAFREVEISSHPGALRDVEIFSQLGAFRDLVLETNQKMNLTAITSEADFAVKHFADSLSLLPFLPPMKEGYTYSLLDIGTGAGFPGVPLKIVRPDLRLTLLDGTRKKIDFLAAALDKLGIAASCIHARAEDLPRLMPGAIFDIVTARAVGLLKELAAYALPLTAPGGKFLAMKGPDVSREIKEAASALDKHRGTVERIAPVELAPGMIHTIIVIKKG